MRAFKVIIITVFFTSGCTLFNKDEKILAEHQKSNGEKIRIYYVSLGATTNDVIQVRKSKRDTPIWAVDKYNYLKSSKLVNDTLLQMVLSDTGFRNNNNKFDTVLIKVN